MSLVWGLLRLTQIIIIIIIKITIFVTEYPLSGGAHTHTVHLISWYGNCLFIQGKQSFNTKLLK